MCGQIGGQGVFTSEIENALAEGSIDLAVHSLKDLPTTEHPQLIVAATPKRADVRDVILSTQTPDPSRVAGLQDLQESSRVGTGSPRRRSQLLALRPDLNICPIRGNVDTRIAKLRGGDFDTIVLAAAGLQRLGRSHEINFYLDTTQVLPAPGQGALGLQMRRDDDNRNLVSRLHHPSTWAGVTAERSFLRTLSGGCQEPFAAWGRVISKELIIDGVISRGDGSGIERAAITGDPAAAEDLGIELARRLSESIGVT